MASNKAKNWVFGGAAALAMTFSAAPAWSETATVIELTQTACQFVESENGVDHGYTTTKKEDCEQINAQSGAERLNEAKVLTLKPGKYVFRVTNQNVPYELGFWVRESDYDWKNPLDKLTKTSVSGGGLDVGVTKDYEVELELGEYVYSCPLNPTPDYKIIVEG
ncbi:MAG: hypothetical protein AAF530_11060 [Pseudomonadota bacterium]